MLWILSYVTNIAGIFFWLLPFVKNLLLIYSFIHLTSVLALQLHGLCKYVARLEKNKGRHKRQNTVSAVANSDQNGKNITHDSEKSGNSKFRKTRDYWNQNQTVLSAQPTVDHKCMNKHTKYNTYNFTNAESNIGNNNIRHGWKTSSSPKQYEILMCMAKSSMKQFLEMEMKKKVQMILSFFLQMMIPLYQR